MKRRKALDVAKFGGTEKLGNAVLHSNEHEVNNIETQSRTKLEQDTGYGATAIIRRFTFGINPDSFQKAKPSKQDLFNSHIKGIEVMLWQDGMKIMTDVEPKILLEDKQYHIFVGARVAKGFILERRHIPQTLPQIAHGN